MKKKMFVIASVFAMAGTLTLAYAADIEKGKALFASPTLGGGTTGKSCMTCHDGGEGFGDDLFDRKSHNIMGMDKNSVEEVVNICIERPLGGVAIDPAGEEMLDLIAYMKTLVAK
jgi:cytochrome c